MVGRPDARLGEEVVGVRRSCGPGATATEDELVAYAKERLAATKYPREVRIVPAIPLTSVGKLDRKRLRTQVRGEGPVRRRARSGRKAREEGWPAEGATTTGS